MILWYESINRDYKLIPSTSTTVGKVIPLHFNKNGIQNNIVNEYEHYINSCLNELSPTFLMTKQ